MKKLLRCIVILCTIICCISTCFFTGCEFGARTSEFTIQYTVDSEVRTLTVKEGDPYVLDIPSERFGYEFKGYFDSAANGTQFTDSKGSSLSVFDMGRNVILFPQFEAKEYKLILEADDQVEGEFARSYTIKYDEPLPDLPINLKAANKDFAGWYTREGGKGKQIADKRGIIPGREIFNKENFDITDTTKQISLYSYFEWKKYNVTFKFNDGYPDETVSVEYGTDIAEVVSQTRNSEGKGVISWSKTSNGDIYDGKITEDITLYAVEWAPVIELNLNGGEGIKAIIARAGDAITLPIPVRENYKFLKWVYESGDTANLIKMPAGGAKLKAMWQAMIIFNENGGTEVNDISEPTGETVTLPTTEREGYIFAGWYDDEETEYKSSEMPSESIVLKAGWYKEIAADNVIIASNVSTSGAVTKPDMDKFCYKLSHSDFYGKGEIGYIKLKLHIKLLVEAIHYTEVTVYLDIYNKKSVSSQNLLKTFKFEHVTDDGYREFTFEFETYFSDDLYLCWYCPGLNIYYDDIHLSDFYRTAYYSDTSKLYL